MRVVHIRGYIVDRNDDMAPEGRRVVEVQRRPVAEDDYLPPCVLSLQIGDIGKVVSILRPAGEARFGDKIVDVVSEAAFIETGKTVIVQSIQGNRVLVREHKDDKE